MDLSVIVCTHDRAELLSRLLDSLAAARHPAGWGLGVLVIANACNDGTTGTLRAAEKGPLVAAGWRLRWAEEPSRGKSHALNRALGMLDGDAAVFIDDDHRVDADFLAAIARGLDSYPDVNLFCGRILPDWDGSEPAWIHDPGPYRIYPPPVPVFDAGDEPRDLAGEAFKPGGGNLVFRIPLLASLGLFSTDLGPRGHDLGGGEDSEFLQRALDRGEQLLYLPGILQYHYVDKERLRLAQMLRLSFQRSRASARVHHGGAGVPLYLWRKLGGYLLAAGLSRSGMRRRFFLVRSAAVLGEIRGIAESGAPLRGG